MFKKNLETAKYTVKLSVHGLFYPLERYPSWFSCGASLHMSSSL